MSEKCQEIFEFINDHRISKKMAIPPIRVDPDSVVFPHTYIANTSRMTVKIINDTNHVIRYEWRKNCDLITDLNEMAQLDLGNPDDRREYEKKLLFQSNVFNIEPISSEIWPHRFQQIVITFLPNTDGIFLETAYLFDKLSKFRVPLQMQGLSLPAEAAFNIENIHIGHVNLGDVNDYQILLMNTGQVKADFEFIDTPRENYFDFMPRSGTLEVGGSVPVIVHFEAKHVGQFAERFLYSVNGKTCSNPNVSLFGKVMGPSFVISKPVIDFGNAGFGFIQAQTFTVTNTSKIPLNYKMHFKIDGTFEKHELCITPDTGVIQAGDIGRFTVEFLPKSVKTYHATLEFIPTDLEAMNEIEIKAVCVCPEITLQRNTIEVGEIFINKRIMTQIIAFNNSEFPARYEFIECKDPSVLEAKFEYDNDTGVINANGRTVIPVYITPKMIGQIRLTRFIKISGANYRPLDFGVTGYCIGPRIKMSDTKIDFGPVTVLAETEKTLLITNNSPIEASFKAAIKSGDAFKLPVENAVIEAYKTYAFPVTAMFNDPSVFSSEIEFIFQHLPPMTVGLSGKGIGCPLVSSISMGTINVDTLFTNEPHYIDFTMVNKGRKSIDIKWNVQRPKSLNGKTPQISFSPETATFKVGEEHSFRITVISSCSTRYSCTCSCISIMNRKTHEIYSPLISGTFIEPLITFAKPKMVFSHYHDTNNESRTATEPSINLLKDITQSNTLTNTTELEVTLYVDSIDYFDITPNVINLKPGESADFDVTFKTSLKKDFLSQKIDSAFKFALEGNPTMISLPVVANYVFPNLQFSSSSPINFGVLSSETEITKDLSVKNPTQVDCHYSWELLSRANDPSVAQVFDVFPNSGVISPGASEVFHFNFYGRLRDPEKKSARYDCIAICHTTGGPDYTVNLIGEVAKVECEVEPKKIDFGARFYNDTMISNIVIKNRSVIPLDFSIQIPKQTTFKYISVEPMSGVVEREMTANLKIKITPGIPRKYLESINVMLGRFDVIPIQIEADCHFPQLYIEMDRDADDPVIEAFKNRPRKKSIEPSLEHLLSIERELFSDMLQAKLASGNISGRKKATEEKETYVSGIFYIDFGDIMVGDDRSIEKAIKTICPLPVSFEIIDDSLENTGFTISSNSFRNVYPDSLIPLTFKFETEKRTTNISGNVEFPIYVAFSETFCYLIRVVANITIPCLSFSKAFFNFESTIIGQRRTMHLQIQNMNKIPSEFSINRKIFESKKIPKGVFSIEPMEGIINPNSYENIVITFTPKSSRQYTLEVPFITKYNEDMTFVTLKGQGYSLKVEFEPESIVFSPRLPFSDPHILRFKIKNPTMQTVEVYSTQFDAKLAQGTSPLKNQSSRDSVTMSETKNESASSSKKSMVQFGDSLRSVESKLAPKIIPKQFSMCIIVHGSPKSGKTYVSRLLSSHLNLPVIRLASIWENVDRREELIQEIFASPDFSRGFIIDGLDGIPDGKESELFLSHSLKTKNILDDVSKNPFMDLVKNGETTSSIECLYAILNSLTCHYVFLIGVTCPVDLALKRIEDDSIQMNNEKIERLKKEMERISLMDEEEYNSLSDIEKHRVDSLRMMARQEITCAEEKSVEMARKSRLGIRMEKAPVTNSFKSVSGSIAAGKPSSKKKLTKEEEMMAKINLFLLSFGSLSKIVQERRENTIVVDPTTLQLPNKVKFDSNDSNKCTSFKNINSLFISVTENDSDIYSCLNDFFPRWNVMREKVFQQFIPEPELIVSEEAYLASLILEPISDCFQLVQVDEHQIEEPERSPSPLNKSRRTIRGGSMRRLDKPKFLASEQTFEPTYTPRWTIEPDSSVTLGVRFLARPVGDYQDLLNFQIVGGSGTDLSLPVSASCMIPEIERSPNLIFPRTSKKLLMRTENSWIENLKEFHFGCQLVMKERAKNQPPAYKAVLTIRNVGILNAEVTAMITESTGGRCPFSVENPFCNIAPNSYASFNIGFHPLTAERFKTTLSFFVKDNPEPLQFVIAGDGCIPSIEANLTNLDFGRVVTDHAAALPITLHNNGKTSAYWKLKGTQQLENFLSFSAIEGLVNAQQSIDITATFCSKRAQIVKKPIQIDIMDKNKLRMFSTFHIQVSAEAFDINFDFLYPKGVDHLYFGDVMVNTKEDLVCTIKNKGKYASQFKLFIDRKAAKYLKANCLEGTVTNGEKGAKQIVFSFFSETPMEIKNQVVANLKVNDTVTGTPLGLLPIKLSVSCCYSKIRIDPPFLDFGLCEMGDVKTLPIMLYNDGAFPFDFTLTSNDVSPPSRNASRAKKIKARPKAKTKVNPMRFFFGSFGCTHCNGVVPPKGSLQLFIEYAGLCPAEDNSELLFAANNLDPETKGEIKYSVKAKTSLPSIETDDFEKIFPSTTLCLRYDLSRNEQTCFLEDEQILHFQAMTTKTSKSVRIRLVNNIEIPAVVDAALKPIKKSDNSKLMFSISEKTFNLGPHQAEELELTFTPEKTGKFSCIFEATPHSTASKDAAPGLIFRVEGEGALPIVSLAGVEKSKKFQHSFGRTLVGFSREKGVCIQNTGVLPATVTINAQASPDFALLGVETSSFVLLPGRSVNPRIVFQPTKTKRSTFDVNVKVEDNSSSDFSMNFVGDGVVEDIIIDGLQADDSLIFKDAVIGKKETIDIILKNISTSDYRFMLEEVPGLMIVPSQGHIHKHTVKKVSVTFLADNVIKYFQQKLGIKVMEIDLPEFTPDWDDSMKIETVMMPVMPPSPIGRGIPATRSKRKLPTFSNFSGSSSRMSNSPFLTTSSSRIGFGLQSPKPGDSNQTVWVVKDEPLFTPLNKSKEYLIKVTARSDNIHFVLDSESIAFPPTMMFERRLETVSITNTCSIKFGFKWYPTVPEEIRISEGQPPFTVEPSEGVIEPGNTTKFNIIFAPTTVGSFQSRLVCDIPSLSINDEPTIFVSGSSQRPVCHVTCETSDYLNRRYPEYTYDIPQNTRVLEIFSKGIGVSSSKVVEVLNTMETAYDAVWSLVQETTGEGGIECDQTLALVSSGKTLRTTFTYKPVKAKTIESLWQLSIPSMETTAYILVVGRIMPR